MLFFSVVAAPADIIFIRFTVRKFRIPIVREQFSTFFSFLYPAFVGNRLNVCFLKLSWNVCCSAPLLLSPPREEIANIYARKNRSGCTQLEVLVTMRVIEIGGKVRLESIQNRAIIVRYFY